MPKRPRSKYASTFLVSDNSIKCSLCEYATEKTLRGGTNSLRHHLQKNHPDTLKEIDEQEAEMKRSKLEETRNQAVLPFPVSKSVHCALEGRPQVRTLGEWAEGGEKHTELEMAIGEMICIDLLPFRCVEKSGLKRVLQIARPSFKLKGRDH